MFGKLDLFKNEWLEVIFENRNKEYGAYQLRKTSARSTNIGMLIVFVAVLLLSLPKVFGFHYFPKMEPTPKEESLITLDEINIDEKEEEEEKIFELPIEEEKTAPQLLAQDPPLEDLIRFPEPTVVDAKAVKEEIVSQDDIKEKKATPARLTLSGSPTGSAVPNGEFGPQKMEGAISGSLKGDPKGEGGEDTGNIFVSVAIAPEPPGGIDAFRNWIAKEYDYPESAISQGVKGVVEFTFVVEIDGSLTDIKALRDVGYGTAAAGVKVLQKAKKWKPGIQNGRPVRVQFRLPLRLDLSQM